MINILDKYFVWAVGPGCIMNPFNWAKETLLCVKIFLKARLGA